MLRYNDYPVPGQSDTVNSKLLVASTAASDTIPVGAKFVVMTASVTSYFRIGATATVPGVVTDGSASDTIPANFPIARALVNTTTKGSVITGTTSLTVDSTDGLTIGNTISIAGAGAAGVVHNTTITAINQSTKTITLGVAAVTTVVGTAVTHTPTTISLISSGTPIVTLAYYK